MSPMTKKFKFFNDIFCRVCANIGKMRTGADYDSYEILIKFKVFGLFELHS